MYAATSSEFLRRFDFSNSSAMAQKLTRDSLLDEPPTASEDDHDEDDDEEASSEETTLSEEEDEDEHNRTQPSTLPPPAPTISHPKPSSSDSATESDSVTDSEPEPDPPVPNPKLKPHASKPMENNKPIVLALPCAAAPPTSGSKRSVENTAHMSDPKRAKKELTSVPASADSDEEIENVEKLGEDPKPFQRVFSNEDEIVILKGMVDFASETGLDPNKNTDQFYDFVKRLLHSGATSNQLKQKIRRLKKKFEINSGKGKDGEDPCFSKPHERKSFELSKMLWAGEAVEKGKPNGKPAKSTMKEVYNKNVASGKKSKPETEVVGVAKVVSTDLKEPEKMEVDEKHDDSISLLSAMFCFEKDVGLWRLSIEDAVKRGLDSIGASKRAELEKRWKELHISSLELLEKHAELIQDQARLIVEAYKSSNH